MAILRPRDKKSGVPRRPEGAAPVKGRRSQAPQPSFAPPPPSGGPAPARNLLLAPTLFFGELESQPTGDGRGLCQPDADRVAEAVHRASAIPDQSVPLFVVPEKLHSQSAHGQETVGPGIGEAHEQSKPRHAGYAPGK